MLLGAPLCVHFNKRMRKIRFIEFQSHQNKEEILVIWRLFSFRNKCKHLVHCFFQLCVQKQIDLFVVIINP
jgi:hypothetical protein